MALVQVNPGGSLYGPTGGNMSPPDFTAWNHASAAADGATAELSPFGPGAMDLLTSIRLAGTGLTITPDLTENGVSNGPYIFFRQATGTINSFTYLEGTSASHGTITASYTISGLNVSFQQLLLNTVNPFMLLLNGDDEVRGTDFIEILSGYNGNDVFLPGYARNYTSGTWQDYVDGGNGSDTVSYANMAFAITINLATGAASGNLATLNDRVNAILVSIENAIGGAGNDILTGDANANVLSGGGGNDQVYGGAGSDTLNGDAGNDILRGDAGADALNGGGGIDRADYNSSLQGVTVNLATGAGQGGDAQGDTLRDIENLFGSAQADVLTGNDGANSLYGYNGDDKIYGLAGNDVLNGQAGNDQLYGGSGSDNLIGDSGNDVLRGDEGADVVSGGDGTDRADYNNSNGGVTINLAAGTAAGGHAAGDTLSGIENLFGSAHADALTGTDSANSLWGYDGDDQIFGLAGSDYLDGMNGNDALFGGNGNDTLLGGAGVDGLFGDAGNDSISGGADGDYIEGGDGADTIRGDAGDDQLLGGAGNDLIYLGAGDDGITLGQGDDKVRYEAANGADTIFDFGNGADVIDFAGSGLTLAAVQAGTIETAAGVLISLAGGSILLEGLTLTQIDWSADFLFGG